MQNHNGQLNFIKSQYAYTLVFRKKKKNLKKLKIKFVFIQQKLSEVQRIISKKYKNRGLREINK